jgi:putative ABC transport system permease protein
MLTNYLKIIIRNLFKNKVFSVINVSGLALGISVCFLIYLWVQDELNYDTFHRHAENIYRVERRWDFQDMHGQGATTAGRFGPTMVADYHEITDFVRLDKAELYIKDHRNTFQKQELFLADNSVFEIFDFHLVEGDQERALDQPRSVVLTKELALKYLETIDCLGKSISIDWQGQPVNFIVTGILDDIPHNSHIQFDMLISMSTHSPELLAEWLNNPFHTYILVDEKTIPHELEKKFSDFLSKYLTADFVAYFGEDTDVNDVFKIRLKSVLDIHLNPTRNHEIGPQGNKTSVYIFSFVAILILVIACINFVNLSTARANIRAREVGMRKTIGASQNQLRSQFLVESVSLAFFSLLISLLMIELFLPVFNGISGKSFSGMVVLQQNQIFTLITITFASGIFAGMYPAFYLASFDPIRAIRGSNISGQGKLNFRKIMTVLQFSVSITLIICTLIIYNQLEFFQTRSLGFDKENIIVIEAEAGNINENIDAFRQALTSDVKVTSVSASSNIIGDHLFYDTNFRYDNSEEYFNLLLLGVDYDYVNTYNLNIMHGREFLHEYTTDKADAFIINEQAARTLGINPEEAIGKKLIMTIDADKFRESTIVGVVRDFNFQSLHRRIEPLVMFLTDVDDINAISIKISAGTSNRTISFIKSTWENIYPGTPFTYSFIDSRLINLYKSEENIQKVFTIFATISILIACLGLFGLSSYTADERRKEIGVRRVLGASVSGIINMLSSEYTKWVLLANFIAWPIAWYMMDHWLMNFNYRIDIGWLVFIVSGLTAMLIAQLTVITQTVRVAISNPIDAIKYE